MSFGDELWTSKLKGIPTKVSHSKFLGQWPFSVALLQGPMLSRPCKLPRRFPPKTPKPADRSRSPNRSDRLARRGGTAAARPGSQLSRATRGRSPAGAAPRDSQRIAPFRSPGLSKVPTENLPGLHPHKSVWKTNHVKQPDGIDPTGTGSGVRCQAPGSEKQISCLAEKRRSFGDFEASNQRRNRSFLNRQAQLEHTLRPMFPTLAFSLPIQIAHLSQSVVSCGKLAGKGPSPSQWPCPCI